MPRPRQEINDNPSPTSLFMCYAAVLLFVGTGDAILNVKSPYKRGCTGTGKSQFSDFYNVARFPVAKDGTNKMASSERPRRTAAAPPYSHSHTHQTHKQRSKWPVSPTNERGALVLFMCNSRSEGS